MSETFEEGELVRWTWGAYEAEGRIREVFTERVSRTIKGTHVVRKATPEKPAYLIEQADGGEVLKSASELSRP